MSLAGQAVPNSELCRIGNLIDSFCKLKITADFHNARIMAVSGLRGICARHHDLFTRNMPNAWFAMARLTVDYLVIIQVLVQPFQYDRNVDMLQHDRLWVTHLLFTLLSAFCASSAYWVCWSIVELLANPFRAGQDSYLPDALMASTVTISWHNSNNLMASNVTTIS